MYRINNKTHYPTPPQLISRMFYKIPERDRAKIQYVLEPSAGDGAILEYLKSRRFETSAIEIDPDLIAVLKGKGFDVISNDFLDYTGHDKFDLIIANPPFDEGDKHLLKAIDIMYSGHIVFLLNAETIKNPYTNTRKLLKQRLDELNADIEYIANGFSGAERYTDVETALVHIHIDNDIQSDLFDGVNTDTIEDAGEAHEQKEITEKDSIKNLVASYNRAVDLGTQSLLGFYKNYHHIGPFMQVVVGGDEKTMYGSAKDLTALMKTKLNEFLRALRKSYWVQALKLDAIQKRLTKKKRDEFYEYMKKQHLMDFTEHNIRTFILNLIDNYEGILLDATIDLFEKMTIKSAYNEELHTENIHYFNGWKTNKAYRVNKKVVLRMSYGGEGHGFLDWSGRWDVRYDIQEELNDIDRVMNYFEGKSDYISIVDALQEAFKEGENRGVLSTFFKISAFKKGTIHLEFLDDNILRRFNVTACKGKGWLPHNYGQKKYDDMDWAEQDTVDSFEDEKTYSMNLTSNPSLFYQNSNQLRIEVAA